MVEIETRTKTQDFEQDPPALLEVWQGSGTVSLRPAEIVFEQEV
jgi:hypothetical protein